jgi:hypothetical protein
MKATLIAFPAYGRRYISASQMRQDFLKGKDFSASQLGGPYFSIRDFTENQNCADFSAVRLHQNFDPILTVILSRSEMSEPMDAIEALRACVGSLERANVAEGYCCCGSPMESHDFGSGHSAVDMGEYYADKALEAARAVLRAHDARSSLLDKRSIT